MEFDLTYAEKKALSALYEAALKRHKSTHSSSSEDEFAPFLVKESATSDEYEFVSGCLTKYHTEWIQGRIFVQPTSNLVESIKAVIYTTARKALREQKLQKCIKPGGAPPSRWNDGGYRRPSYSFYIRDSPAVWDKTCLICEVNYKGLATATFLEKLEGWITQTEQVMVVIGWDLKPSLGSIHVYYYVRSSEKQTTAVSQFLDDEGVPTFSSLPPLTHLDIDLKGLFRQHQELYDRLFPNVNGQPVEHSLRISLTDVLDEALIQYRFLLL